MNKLSTLAIALVLLVLFSCNFRKTQLNEIDGNGFAIDTNYYKPLTIYDIDLLFNWTIYLLEPYPDTLNYTIYPYFSHRITDNDILDNLSQVIGRDSTTIYYNEVELNQFINDNNYLKSQSVKLLISEYFENFISEDFSDVVIFLGPPMVDRKNFTFCIFLHKMRKYKDGYALHDFLCVYKHTPENEEWEIYHLEELRLSWTINNSFTEN